MGFKTTVAICEDPVELKFEPSTRTFAKKHEPSTRKSCKLARALLGCFFLFCLFGESNRSSNLISERVLRLGVVRISNIS